MNKKNCIGCRNDFYNDNNPYDVKDCWNFKSAKMVWKKEVHIDQRPPWNQKAKRFPGCYHKPHFVYVNPKTTF